MDKKEPPIDRNAILRLHKLGGKKLVAQMIDLFVKETPKRLQSARDGEKAGNLEAIERATHSLKTSAGNLGAGEMGRLSAEIEQLAFEKKGEGIPPLLRALEQAFSTAAHALEEEVRTIEP